MKITALTENTCHLPHLGCEHGLSLFIETGDCKILFDTGQSRLFAENAAKLGIDLGDVDFVVLSHGHYDHGGGLERFIQINKTAPIYLNKNAFEPHFNGVEKYIGLDPELKGNPRLIFTGETYEITDGIVLYTCNERERRFPLDAAGLNMVQNGIFLPEDFRHEHYLHITEGSKRIVISGCSHKGIRDIVGWLHPDVLVGGFHLMKTDSKEILAAFADELDRYLTEYYTCHCKGTAQYEFLRTRMKRLHYLSAGESIQISTDC